MRLMMRRQLSGVSLAFVLFAMPWAALAQETQNVEVEPVTCWWRTSISLVRVGQPFSLILTCSALETEATKAVIDRSRLGSSAVQLPPYEVTGGVQSEDLITASRRFMQYEYNLRLIGDDVFGADVPIPPLQIAYRIESKVQQDASVQGREQTYILPPLPMHIAALVPNSANHIREAPVTSVAAIAARDARGTLLRAVAGILFGVAALVLLVSLIRSVQQRRSAVAHARTHLLSDAAILRGVGRELRTVQQHARGGWDAPLAARALAALRVTASYATGQPVTQRTANGAGAGGGGGDEAGHLVFDRRFGFSEPVVVSGAATANDVALKSNHGLADDLKSALSRLTTARYGRKTAIDDADLNDAIESGIRANGRVAAEHTWIAETARSARRLIPRRRKRS